ncbi:D-3-phosphoglycerate dehydrogenase [Candidatus Desulfarcum epimagneticum]|uniref:D-3-phosphoglycerate dehydrogenase n=1 Tax=uncultured Desulfobacteraceae bacterium TaxID=218296 RepID=A0A484HE23_9BACT|nr:D-3-phosphoglycerate dehydrogenase [uncultured Desulfobacteraceae bacterium]
MKVLVSDTLGDAGIRMFEEANDIEVDVKVGLSPDELKDIIGDYDALAIRSATKVTEDVLDAAKKLKVVGRAGIGLDNVDIPAATKRGVVVMNTPGGNVITTAEHAIAMMLSLTRNIPQGTGTLKDGKWEKKKLQGRELYNKTLGVIGFGKIGSIVADRARGLKMKVIIHDPFVTSEKIEKEGFTGVSLEELCDRSDYITIHVPKLKDTAGMIGQEQFDMMKDGVMLINCARGGIVDEKALYDALESGKVAGAALDVFESEPPGESPLFKFDKLICTPHLGASTKEAQTNVAVAVADQIIDYLTTGTVVNAVNTPSVTGDLLESLGPFISLGGMIGALQARLTPGAVKEVSIEYKGDFQDMDLTPVSSAVLKDILAPAVKDDVNFVNALVLAKERGIKITESTSPESEEYINLVTVKASSDEASNTVSGTVYGKKEARVVRINSFRLEMVPEGHLALIYNHDRPGAIGEIGACMGKNNINIGRMQVGQDREGERNIIFLSADTPIPDDVLKQLQDLPAVKSAMLLDF